MHAELIDQVIGNELSWKHLAIMLSMNCGVPTVDCYKVMVAWHKLTDGNDTYDAALKNTFHAGKIGPL